MTKMQRREFLGTALAGLSLGSSVFAAQEDHPSGVPTRPLGKTGQRVSIIGLGGHHIGVGDLTDNQSVSLMHEAIDEGITFFDNCMHYNGGRSEQLMGKSLSTGGRRDKVFLMTKVCGRDYQTTREQIDDCLKRLQTDHIDLLQHHSIGFDDDPQRILDAEAGSLRATREARDAGKVRYVGLTSHTSPHLLAEMLQHDFAWAACQMVLNVADAFDPDGFQKVALTKCVEQGVGVLGMKALGAGPLVASGKFGVDAVTCRRYQLSLPISCMICGIQSRKDLQQDLAIARGFRPMTADEIAGLPDPVQSAGQEGRIPGKSKIGCRWYYRERTTDRDQEK